MIVVLDMTFLSAVYIMYDIVDKADDPIVVIILLLFYFFVDC